MSEKVITVTEAVRHFADYIGRVSYRHESFVLRKGKKTVAELRPMPSGRRLGDLPAILLSLPCLLEEDRTTFSRDVEAAREATASTEIRDPWAS